MSRKKKRLVLIMIVGALLASSLTLILLGLRDKIVFFRTPTEVMEGKVTFGQIFRLGGLVEAGSFKRNDKGEILFSVTDGNRKIDVIYKGLLPDLFREGQGVVAEGGLQHDGSFIAANVLAKHDENYMPREVADALKKQGQWRDNKGK